MLALSPGTPGDEAMYSNTGQEDWCQTRSLRVLLFTYEPSFLVVLWAADWLPVGDHSDKWQGDPHRETLQLRELRERHSWCNLQSTQNGETDHSVEDGGDNIYRIFLLLSTCAYISTGRKPVPNSEMRLTENTYIQVRMRIRGHI